MIKGLTAAILLSFCISVIVVIIINKTNRDIILTVTTFYACFSGDDCHLLKLQDLLKTAIRDQVQDQDQDLEKVAFDGLHSTA